MKDIRLGPPLPALRTPYVFDNPVTYIDIKSFGTADEDLKAILG